MALDYGELESFYEGLVSQARARGVTCAITSGMACVAFGIAQTTKDCALLCAPDAAEKLLQLLEAGDARGWLHIYDADLLRAFAKISLPPATFLKKRPTLGLAIDNDARLRTALHAEVQYWQELDRVRLQIYEAAVRPYRSAVKKSSVPGVRLAEQHSVRVKAAEDFLPLKPVVDFGVDRMITEARDAVAQLVNPQSMTWLPDVREHFIVSSA